MIVPATVCWRPGCPFCARLCQDLQMMGLPVREVNIWADPAAAAQVRQAVPGFTPDEALARAGRRRRLLRAVRWAVTGGLVSAGLIAEAAGHSGLGWLTGGAAVAVWLLFRLAGRRGTDRAAQPRPRKR